MRRTPTRSRYSPFLRLLPFLIAVLMMACGGGDSPTDTTDTGPKELKISLAASSADPLELIKITGIPPGRAVYAVVRVPGGDARGSAVVDEVSGVYYLTTPLSPADPIAGGDVTIRISGPNLTSNAVSLTVGGLPEATVGVADLVDDMQAMLSAWLTFHGTTREAMRAAAQDPTGLPANLMPLVVAYDLLENPDNPNSMRAAVDGPIPGFGDEPLDWDLFNRILTIADAKVAFDEEVADVDELAADTLIVGNTVTIGGTAVSGTAPVRRQTADDCLIDGATYGIDNAYKLDIAMKAANFGRERLDGASGEALWAMSKTLSLAGGLLGGAADGDAGVAFLSRGVKFAAGAAWILQKMSEAASSILPSYFDGSGTQYSVTKMQLFEDDIQGEWKDFQVRAMSTGWIMDKFIVAAILKLAPMGPLGEVFRSFEEPVVGEVVKFITTNVLQKLYGGSESISICPQEWTVMDGMSDIEYSRATVVVGNSISVLHQEYYPEQVGVSELRVETAPGHFGSQATLYQRDIEVLPIIVEVEPAAVALEPNTEQLFFAAVTNANNTAVKWIIDPRLIEIGANASSITVKTPDAWDSPMIVKARSISEDGARFGLVDSDPRDGIGVIAGLDTVAIAITPTFKCLLPGESFKFEPHVVGITNYTVIWEKVEGYGSIDTTGTYHSLPSGTSTAKISARVEGFPNAIAYASIKVGACTCFYDLVVSGAYNFQLSGGDVAYIYQDLGDGYTTYQFIFMLDAAGAPQGTILSAGSRPAQGVPQIGETGTFEMDAAFSNGSQTWTSLNAPIVVQITEHTDTYMVGTFSGNLTGGSPGSSTTVFIECDFRAGRMITGWPCD